MPKTAKQTQSTDLPAHVEQLRVQIEFLKRKRDAIQRTLLPKHEAVERVQQMVDGQAAGFAADAQGR